MSDNDNISPRLDDLGTRLDRISSFLACDSGREGIMSNRAKHDKTYREKHKDRLKEYHRRYYMENRQRVNSRQVAYNKMRYHNDPTYKLAMNLRNRMRHAVRGGTKVGSAIRELGCSVIEFRKYIEDQFHAGMSWENHGTLWHIDHILPLANYDLTDRGTFRRLVHYTNMQPMLATENLRKGNRE